MSKKSKTIIYYTLSLILVIIAPIFILRFVISASDELFYERVQENKEFCYQRAKQDSVDLRWCDEIEDGARLAYFESVRQSKFSFLELMLLALLFTLAIRVNNLSKQVEELKEKIDV